MTYRIMHSTVRNIINAVFDRKIITQIVDGKPLPYLTRWHLVKTPWFGLYLHKIERSDEDPDRHDHPWSFGTVVLSGSYIDDSPQEQDVLKRFSFRWRHFSHKHRVIKNSNKPILTLIFRGTKDRKTWGFHTANGFKTEREYVELNPNSKRIIM